MNRKPGWSEEQIDNEAILMRAYGNHTEIIIDRESMAFFPSSAVSFFLPSAVLLSSCAVYRRNELPRASVNPRPCASAPGSLPERPALQVCPRPRRYPGRLGVGSGLARRCQETGAVARRSPHQRNRCSLPDQKQHAHRQPSRDRLGPATQPQRRLSRDSAQAARPYHVDRSPEMDSCPSDCD